MNKVRRKAKLFVHKLRKLYYKLTYGIDMHYTKSHYPLTGKGKFVSVYKKGAIYDLVDEKSKNNDFLRLIPYQPNHGFFIEHWAEGKIRGRIHIDYDHLLKHFNGGREANV